ncbi:hypothetical protein Taro_051317, partial [Colocasia esculenta]|nr:hypothetical protein [Colocasia esculenta]
LERGVAAAGMAGQGLWGVVDYSGPGPEEDFSASATLVHFDRPLPLLRPPLPAGAADDPSAGPFVLAFRSADCWRSAYRRTEAQVVKQCEAGARMGCALSASKKCRPPWWKSLFGVGAVDFAERERCEERETLACVEASKEPCIRFANEKCLPPFRDARISSISLNGLPHSSCSQTCNSGPEGMALKPEHGDPSIAVVNNLQINNLESTNYRGSALLQSFLMEESCRGRS